MKYCVIIPEGIPDHPHPSLRDRTPLEAAHATHMDTLALEGRLGTVRNIPEGMPAASEIAMLSILGYNPRKYPVGRGMLEALGMGLPLQPGMTYLCCNLVTLADNVMADHSAGYISDKEAAVLLQLLNQQVAPPGCRFIAQASYRCIMSCPADMATGLRLIPPQDILGKCISNQVAQGRGATVVRGILERSREVLANHDINKVRADLGENPANAIWLWGAGPLPELPAFGERHGKRGTIISRAAYVHGLARRIGWEPQGRWGAPEKEDTDYSAVAQEVLRCLQMYDLVVVHLEAADEASHQGDPTFKRDVIAAIDRLVVAPILNAFCNRYRGRVLLVPGHFTTVEDRTHTDEPVPFALFGDASRPARALPFRERVAHEADLQITDGHDLMQYFLRE